MHSRSLCALVVVFYASLTSAQKARGAGGGGGGGGSGGGGGEGGLGNALMNDPFAFRRFFHPLANQRFMSSMGFNPYTPNFATMSLLLDMELPDALLYSALTGGNPLRPRGRFRGRQQPQANPFLVALGIVDGVDLPDPVGQGRRGRRRGGRGRGANRANRPPKARRGRQGAGGTEAGPAGASEVRGGQ